MKQENRFLKEVISNGKLRIKNFMRRSQNSFYQIGSNDGPAPLFVKVVLMVAIFIGIFAIESKGLAQESTPTVIIIQSLITVGIPTVTATPTKNKRKHKWIEQMQGDTPTRQEAHEADEKNSEELQKEGKLKLYGTPGTFRRVPKPSVPTNFKIKPGNGFADLSWDPVSGDDMAYLVYVSEYGKKYQLRILAPIRKTKVAIGNLTNGKKYYFAVSALGGKESDKAVQVVVPMANNPTMK